MHSVYNNAISHCQMFLYRYTKGCVILKNEVLNNMLFQKSLKDIEKRPDIYESKTYQINGRFKERNILDIQQGFNNYRKESLKNNLGEKVIGLIM